MFLKYHKSDGASRFRCSEIKIVNDDLISKWKINIEDRDRIICIILKRKKRKP